MKDRRYLRALAGAFALTSALSCTPIALAAGEDAALVRMGADTPLVATGGIPAPAPVPVATPTPAPVAAPVQTPVAAPTQTPVATPTPVAAPAQTPVATNVAGVNRLGGASRYDTMASLVLQGFSSSQHAIVASGSSYADALAASALAGAYRCPVVLTEPRALSAQASSVLGSLGATNITVVGGPAAVSDSVAGILGAQRVGGADRYATAVETMRLVRSINASSDTVIVATGTGFADALSVSPYAWRSVSPILLTQPNGTLRSDAINAIRADVGIRRIVLVGGSSVVSDRVMDQLGGGYAYERLGGANRYETSSRVAEWSVNHGLGWSNPVMVTGRGFADALSAAAVSGSMGSVLLLADGSNDPTMALLRQNGAQVSQAFVAGGEAAVPVPLMNAMAAAIR